MESNVLFKAKNKVKKGNSKMDIFCVYECVQIQYI